MPFRFPQRQVSDPKVQQNFEALEDVLPTIVTALPSRPADGQEVYFVADATNGVVWHLRYRAASTSIYKWEFVGGPALVSEVNTAETATSATFTDLSTLGPDVTLPLGGDFEITVGAGYARNNSGGGSSVVMSYAIGAATAADVDGFQIDINVASNGGPGVATRPKTGLAALTLLRAKYRSTAGTMLVGRRYLIVRPVRVG